MPPTVDSLAQEALGLPPDQRVTLAHRLLASIEPKESPEIEAAWDAEVRERIAKYDSGQTKGVPASEVFSELERRLRR